MQNVIYYQPPWSPHSILGEIRGAVVQIIDSARVFFQNAKIHLETDIGAILYNFDTESCER